MGCVRNPAVAQLRLHPYTHTPNPVVAPTPLTPNPVVAPTHLTPNPVVTPTHLTPNPVVTPTHLTPNPVVTPTHLTPNPVVAPTPLTSPAPARLQLLVWDMRSPGSPLRTLVPDGSPVTHLKMSPVGDCLAVVR